MKLTISNPQEISKVLKDRGIRPTTHRVKIAEYVLKPNHHFTADEVTAWADTNLRKVSRATVYNTLNEFVQAGLLRTFQSQDASRTVFDSTTHDHFHLFDSSTHQYMDVDPSMIELKSDLLKDFEVEGVEVLIRGRRRV